MELLSDLIAAGADRDPDRVAFRFLDQQLTYQQAEARTNQIARVLAEAGVRRGDRVGVYLNKSLKSPLAIFGIMKAGAAYVPMDPTAPPDRLARMVRDCGIRHVISHAPKHQDMLDLLQRDTSICFVLGLDELPVDSCRWEHLTATTEQRMGVPNQRPSDLAYVMYTSGSTGEPKGMMHTHHSGMSFTRFAAVEYGVCPEDRLSNHSGLHFDMSTFDFFAGMFGGATTVIIPAPHMSLPASLSRLIEQERLTIWYSVPFALIQLLLRGVLEERDMSSLRWVLFGGEPFPTKHLSQLCRLWPHARFSNSFGPAEVNQCTYHHLPAGGIEPRGDVPIGQLWPGTEALIVDENDRPVTHGAGELLVCTPAMMQGYWQRPDLNERAFFTATRPGEDDTTYYRTGDLVERRGDGLLYFLGRKDRQIKARGFRIELDEVESALLAHADVEEAAAYPNQHNGVDAVDAAVVIGGDKRVAPSLLLEFVRQSLPAYAVPFRIRVLPGFPRTATGKIDRQKLRSAAVDDVAMAHS